MATAIRALPRQKCPSEVVVPGLLEGLENVNRLIQPWVSDVAQAANDDQITRQA